METTLMELIHATVYRALKPITAPHLRHPQPQPPMGNDAVLTKSLILLAAVMAFTGLYTQSLNKVGATYFYGMLLICVVALPDWAFFNRPLSQWCNLVPIDNGRHPDEDEGADRSESRLKLFPVRVVMHTAVYGFAFYKWWHFIRGY